MRLELIEVQPGAEEGAHWQTEAAQEVRAKDHPLALLRRRPDLLLRREADLHFVRARQTPGVAKEVDVIVMDDGAVPIPAKLLYVGRHSGR